jgi:hypothetical protein
MTFGTHCVCVRVRVRVRVRVATLYVCIALYGKSKRINTASTNRGGILLIAVAAIPWRTDPNRP